MSLLQSSTQAHYQLFAEDKTIVEEQWPEDWPINLADEVHIANELK